MTSSSSISCLTTAINTQACNISSELHAHQSVACHYRSSSHIHSTWSIRERLLTCPCTASSEFTTLLLIVLTGHISTKDHMRFSKGRHSLLVHHWWKLVYLCLFMMWLGGGVSIQIAIMIGLSTELELLCLVELAFPSYCTLLTHSRDLLN